MLLSVRALGYSLQWQIFADNEKWLAGLDCQSRCLEFKSRPEQKFGWRFLLHLCRVQPSQLGYDEYTDHQW